MAKVVPLFTHCNGLNIGSGFIVALSGRHWLVTAAHIGRGEVGPHSRWQEWPAQLSAVLPTGTVAFQLFNGSLEGRKPRFAHLGSEGDGIADFMAIPLAGAINGVRAHVLDASYSPIVGLEMRALGFPNLGGAWPAARRSKHKCRVTETTRELVRYSPPTVPGFSGGPLIDDDKRLCGLTFGHDDGVGKGVSNFAMSAIIAQSGL